MTNRCAQSFNLHEKHDPYLVFDVVVYVMSTTSKWNSSLQWLQDICSAVYLFGTPPMYFAHFNRRAIFPVEGEIMAARQWHVWYNGLCPVVTCLLLFQYMIRWWWAILRLELIREYTHGYPLPTIRMGHPYLSVYWNNKRIHPSSPPSHY